MTSTWKVPAHNLLRAQAQQFAEIIRTIDPDDPVLDDRRYSTTVGDEAQLRGIPVVGARGVSGAIAGTRPGNVR